MSKSPPSKWDQTKSYSKRGFDSVYNTVDKLGDPVNRLANKIGSEAFWPTTLDKESDKAARILRSFCREGFYEEIDAARDERLLSLTEKDRPKGKQQVLVNIPSEVIKQAKGLAIFTTMRTGIWMSGASGSGVLIARIAETGEWSPPSGILLHTAGFGFLVGVDIYDCVVVINTYEALKAFKKLRCTVGGEVSAVAGPVGAGALLESEIHKRQAPIWTYLKSRGFYAGVQIDGTVIVERTDENERFYGYRLGVEDILAGKVRRPPREVKMLADTVKAAQGDSISDELLPPAEKTPGDCDVGSPQNGLPESDDPDPDPFGVKALEREGVIIREAGTQNVPDTDSPEFHPNDRNSLYSVKSRASSSWRASHHSTTSVDRGVQTDKLPPVTRGQSSYQNDSEERERGDDFPVTRAEPISPSKTSFSKAKVVTIPRRLAPPLPPRNPLHHPGEFPTSESGFEDVDISRDEETLQKDAKFGEKRHQLARTFSDVSLTTPVLKQQMKNEDQEDEEKGGEPKEDEEQKKEPKGEETDDMKQESQKFENAQNEDEEREREREEDSEKQVKEEAKNMEREQQESEDKETEKKEGEEQQLEPEPEQEGAETDSETGYETGNETEDEEDDDNKEGEKEGEKKSSHETSQQEDEWNANKEALGNVFGKDSSETGTSETESDEKTSPENVGQYTKDDAENEEELKDQAKETAARKQEALHTHDSSSDKGDTK